MPYPKLDKWFLKNKKLRRGQGWMQSVPKLMYPKAPHMRGAFICSEDYKKGRRLYINAWFYEQEGLGKIIYFTIASAAERRKMWLKFKLDERERLATERERAQKLWAKLDAAPQEIKRKDTP
jgi:hypothetical protein